VAKLKEQPGKGLIVYGSGDLTNTLMAHDLIDEYRLWVHPVLLGRGSSFFEDGAERMDLDLVDSTAIPSGVAILTYRPHRYASRIPNALPERPARLRARGPRTSTRSRR